MSRRTDPMSVVEAAYELQLPENIWMEGILREAHPILDDGHGTLIFGVDLGGPPERRVHSPSSLGGPADWQRAWRDEWWERVMAPMPADLLASAIALGPVFFLSQALDAMERQLPTLSLYLDEVRTRGLEFPGARRPSGAAQHPGIAVEYFCVQAVDPTGHAIVLQGVRSEVATRAPTRAETRVWTRVTAHIAAAARIRRRLATAGLIEGAEAIIAPGGKIEHATGPAQDRETRLLLRQAAIDVDRARTEKVRSTDDALELWRALHGGRWSILDTFDSDGRRFIVARANEPATDPAPALSRREQQVLDLLALGQSNKLIGYELGISVSSVATHLRRAGAKLGVRGTRELVRWSRARQRPKEA